MSFWTSEIWMKKEKFQEQPEETTRKLLERELRLLDPRDLRSHAWYHGSTLRGGRKGAEAEVPNEGDFLVRDCASQPGNYVLTVRWKGQALHFVINRVNWFFSTLNADGQCL